MDSLTQAALGAAVGHVAAGKEAGRKAIVVGAVAGTLPDLDVLFSPLMDSVAQLAWHRGISHSFLFAVVAAPAFGAIARRLLGPDSASFARWSMLAFWAFVTHGLLDSLTIYGTGLFEPFSDARLAFNLLFIIDPVYTLPLLFGLIMAARTKTDRLRSVRWCVIGLAVSTLYLGFAGLSKSHANRVFEEHFAEKGLPGVEFMSSATPFNTLLWRGLARTDDGHYEAFYSIVADDEPSGFRFIPRSQELLDPIEGTRALAGAKWFSQGFYAAGLVDGSPVLHDLRFGQVGFDGGPYVLTMAFPDPKSTGEPMVEQWWFRSADTSYLFSELWIRIFRGV